ncbi:FecR family protein [Paraflavitalea soli]|uniref:FecR family protein n=1 Tax=Paraflavitalea soli TaxID=2315862 RepID=A0A3B7MZ98_9BACT|nr:FecR family protein [Paraflavitalea soli]AXY78420.1 FecR family protein [Paraflavitalea soli]
MDKSRLAYLFQAYINKTATPAERDEFMQLVEQAENDEQVKSLLTSTWQQHSTLSQPIDERKGEEMLAAILQQGKSEKPGAVIMSRPASWWWRSAVAAAILLFACIGGYLWLTHQPTTQLSGSKQLPLNDTIVPGGNKAELTLADGSKLLLDSTQKGTLTKQGDARVINLNTAVLAYDAGKATGQEVVYNTLATPRGGQYQLLLADGTKVWLNASSSIRFPVAFTGKERNVYITGEAYFEVAKNAAMPFKVHFPSATGGPTDAGKEGIVEVLGTHFNIMAYEDERSVNTTLLEGSVSVSKGTQYKILKPGQEGKITQTGDIRTGIADVEAVMAWKNGLFQFNSLDIERIMRQVARWYDVEVVYAGNIPTGHFSGIVNRNNNITQVLKIMQAGNVNFKIAGRKVIVSEEHR